MEKISNTWRNLLFKHVLQIHKQCNIKCWRWKIVIILPLRLAEQDNTEQIKKIIDKMYYIKVYENKFN